MVAPKTRIVSLSDINPEVWGNVAPANARSPKLLYDWVRCAAKTLNRNGEIKVLVAGPETQPDALLPLGVAPGLLHRHRARPRPAATGFPPALCENGGPGRAAAHHPSVPL